VLVLTIDGNGKIYLQEKGKKKIIIESALPKGIKW
jgi:hypothetical protein